MQLPFSKDNVFAHLVGHKLILTHNHLGKSRYDSPTPLTLNSDGTTDIGSWEVENDVLRLLGHTDQLMYAFNGLESKNGVIYAVGQNCMQANVHGHVRVVLSHFRELTDATWAIVVSSHKDYYEKTLPKLALSMQRSRIDFNKAIVIAEGFDKEETISHSGFKVQTATTRLNGFAAIKHAPAGVDYVFAIDDTVSIMETFAATLNSIDIGNNWDVNLIAPNTYMGVYSSKFLASLDPTVWNLQESKLLDELKARARMWTFTGSQYLVKGTRDIYGYGVKRVVGEYTGVGLQKFSRVVKADGHP